MTATYNTIYMDIRQKLIERSYSQPSLEARELVMFVSGKTREQFYRDQGIYVPEEVAVEAYRLLERRLAGEPIAYITGEWAFMGFPFWVDRRVLIPRTDTELLAETAIEWLKTVHAPRVLDLCTGSGCLGLSVALTLPESRVILSDLSSEVLQVARSNVRRHGLSARVSCIRLDVLKPASISLGKFDCILINPPYIPCGDIEKLDPGVRDYEPHLALDGGEDGLLFYRKVVSGYLHILKKGGALFMECGIGQAEEIKQMLQRAGYSEIVIFRDGNGIDRTIKCMIR